MTLLLRSSLTAQTLAEMLYCHDFLTLTAVVKTEEAWQNICAEIAGGLLALIHREVEEARERQELLDLAQFLNVRYAPDYDSD